MADKQKGFLLHEFDVCQLRQSPSAVLSFFSFRNMGLKCSRTIHTLSFIEFIDFDRAYSHNVSPRTIMGPHKRSTLTILNDTPLIEPSQFNTKNTGSAGPSSAHCMKKGRSTLLFSLHLFVRPRLVSLPDFPSSGEQLETPL